MKYEDMQIIDKIMMFLDMAKEQIQNLEYPDEMEDVMKKCDELKADVNYIYLAALTITPGN